MKILMVRMHWLVRRHYQICTVVCIAFQARPNRNVQVAAGGGGLLAPLAPNPDGKHDQPAALVVEKFWVCSFFASAGSYKAAPANLPARRLGGLSRVSGETSLVSTASWVPFHRGRPLAMTSMRPSSCRWWWWLVLRSLTPMLVETRAPASLQMRAVARSSGLPMATEHP